MNIDSYVATDKNDYRDGLIIKVDGKTVFSAFDGEPEDNSLSRNFSDCYGIVSLMKQAFRASANRESLNVVVHDITWDELFELD